MYVSNSALCRKRLIVHNISERAWRSTHVVQRSRLRIPNPFRRRMWRFQPLRSFHWRSARLSSATLGYRPSKIIYEVFKGNVAISVYVESEPKEDRNKNYVETFGYVVRCFSHSDMISWTFAEKPWLVPNLSFNFAPRIRFANFAKALFRLIK